MKRAVTKLALAAAIGCCRLGGVGPDAQYHQISAACSIAAPTAALRGFGLPDAQGNWTGLDVDYCRALAAAIFNDPTKVKFVALTAKDRFTALQSGDVDVLVAQHHLDLVRATPRSASTSPASTTTTARASWCARR